jgi:TP901 family phage tail tape measure protein
MSTRVGAAHLDLTVLTAPARRELTAFAANARALLTGLTRPVKIEVKADAAQVRAQVDAVKAEFTNLQNSLKNVLKVDVSALKSVISKIGKQITDLTALESRLRSLGGGGSGGGGTGAGGGGPGVNNQYAAQLRALQADLKNSALSTAQFEVATRNLKTTIDREIATLRAAGPLTREQQARLDALRVSSAQAGTALKGLADQQARATREAARGAERTQADGVRRLATELQNAQSRYERGALSLRGYLREMQRIQAAGSGMASGLTAGSRAATDLERVMGGLSRATRGLNDQSITKIRTDMAAARAEFERATAAAGRFGEKRAAVQAFEASMRQLEARIRSVGERATVTTRQAGELGRISTNIRSSLNSLNSNPSGAGLAGSIMAALKQLPQFASVAGGSLGAAAAQAGSLSGSLGGVGAVAGPVGIAIAAVTVAVTALTAAIGASVQTAAQFQQTLVDIRALTQPTAAELDRLRQATFDVGKPLGVGARDAAAAVLELNKAGLSAKDAVGGGLKGALDLAGAAGISAAEGATIAVSAMTAFGLQAQQLPGVADVFANFANKTFLGAADLSQAIAAVGPVARDAGIGLEQFAGLMATLAQGGFKNMSDAGTSLKTMLLSLTAPVDTGAKALKAVGVSAFDAKGQMRPLNDVLGDLKKQLVQLTPEAQKQLLRQIFGQDALRAAQILLREGPRAINANTEAMKKQGEAARVAKERLDSLQGAGKQFGAAFEQLKIQIGTPFLAALTGIVRGATAAVNALTSLNAQAAKGQGAFGQLATVSQQAMTGLGGIVTTIFNQIKGAWDTILWPVLKVLGSVWMTIQVAATTAVTLLFNVVSGVFQGLVSGMGALLAAFGVGQGGITLNLKGIADAALQYLAVARAALVAVAKFTATLPEVFKLAGTGIGTVLGGVTRVLQGFGQGARAVFLAAAGYTGAFASAVGRNMQGIGLIIRGVTGVFGALLLAVRNAFVEKAGIILAAGVRLYGQFTDGVARVLQQGAAFFFRYVVQPVQAGSEFLLAAYNRVSGIVAGAANRIGQVLSPIGNVLKALGLSIGDTLAGVARAAVDTAVGIVDRFAGGARAAYDRAQAAAQAAATGTATSTANGVANALTGATTALGNFAKDNGAGGALDRALGDVSSGLKTVSGSGQQLQKDLAGVTSTLQGGLASASGTAAAGLGEIRTGAQLTGAAVDLVKRNAQDAVQGFTQDVKTLGQTAKATAAAVATIKPPAVMPSGTKTLKDIGLGDDGTSGGTGKTTAADILKQAELKKSLKDFTDLELGRAKAEAVRTNNKEALTAILAEETRRERERAAEVRKGAAADKAATESRATLVREIRQSIDAFALQAKQGKVTERSLLAFNQRMEDLQARVLKLPVALQAGTGALFQQAAALAANAKGQATAARAVALTGVALTEYKEALRGKSEQQLDDMEKQARANKLGVQLNAILAEQKRRAEAKASADRKAAQEAEKHAKTVATLTRETGQLNDRFKLQVQQGKVTAESLLAYRQALADTKAKVDQLPPALRASITALITQGQTLATQGQGIVDHRSEVEKLRAEVDKWTLAELENARARVVAAGGDKDKLAVLDAQIARIKQVTDAQAAQAATESRLAQASADADNAEGTYENRKAAAKGNLSELLQLEIQFGQQVQDARDRAARATAENEERQIREKYGKLLALDGLSVERRKELEADRDRELSANSTRLSNALAKNATDRATAEEDARRNLNTALETLDRDTAARIRASLLADLEQRTRDVEAQQQDELDAEGLTEAQKLEIRKRFQPQLLAAKRAEVDQARAIEEAAERDRYQAAVADADRQGLLDQRRLQQDGSYLTVRQVLERDHQLALGRIRTDAENGYRDYVLGVKRDTGKQITASEKETSEGLKTEIDERIQDLQDNLDTQDAQQRATARGVLQTWRVTYAAMGKSGEAAVAQIDAALRKLDQVGGKIRQNAASLVGNPDQLLAQGGKDLAAVGKPDDETSARAKAEAQFDTLRETYTTKLAGLQQALAAFAETRDQDLTPDERLVRDGLLATQQAYQTLLDNVTLAAAKAGDDAATAFTQAQQDQAAESALALVEAQKALADAEGRDGSPAYLAGLNAALAYWRARLGGLKEGTTEYLDALKRITDLEGKVAAQGNPISDRLSLLAGVVGKGGKLQGTISAGLDGLAAYFKNGGGKGGLIAGAQALVSGLAGVFKTGDEDIDKVIDTFVSGVQATLGALAKGDWIGALIAGVTTLVTTIIDIFTGGANSAKKAAQQISDATKDVKFFDLSKYAKVESRGGFWGFLGFKKSTIDQEAVDIAKGLGDALYTAVSTGLLNGIKQGKRSFSELGLDVREGLGQQILQGLVDGFLKGAVMQGILQPFLDKYIAAMKSGNAQALAEAANGLQGAIAQGNSALAQFYETVLVPAAEQMGQFGTEVQEQTGQTGSSAVDLGLAAAPTAVSAAPAYMTDFSAAATDVAAAFREAVPVLRRLVDDGLRVESESHVEIRTGNDFIDQILRVAGR